MQIKTNSVYQIAGSHRTVPKKKKRKRKKKLGVIYCFYYYYLEVLSKFEDKGINVEWMDGHCTGNGQVTWFVIVRGIVVI